MGNVIEHQSFDEERALYGAEDILVRDCRFDGPADGESAFKESRDVQVEGSFFNLRYPFWHDQKLTITDCELTALCRAALWYSEDITITGTKLHGIKALRECAGAALRGCDIISPVFGWSVRGVKMEDCTAESEYFMMRSDHLDFKNVQLKGKYSFQYIADSVFEDCRFDTKDAFWHAKNVTVKNSVVKGVASFVPLLFSLAVGVLPVFLITSLIAAAFDMIFVIIQRYNRPRLLRLINRRI